MDVGVITENKIEEWESKFDKTEEGFFCKECGSTIQQTTCRASIHYNTGGVGKLGFGEVECLPYPYCPKCDGKPENVTGVIHRN